MKRCPTSLITRDIQISKLHEVSPHISENGQHQKDYKKTNAREGVEKRDLSCTFGGNVNWGSLYGEQHRGSLKNEK